MELRAGHVVSLAGRAARAELGPGQAHPSAWGRLSGEFIMCVHLTKEADIKGVKHTVQWENTVF